jgi:hypothetical protein
MARPNFNVVIQAQTRSGPSGAKSDPSLLGSPVLNTSKWSVETTVGVSRRKPAGFMEPTAYSFFSRRADSPAGYICVGPKGGSPSLGTYITGVISGTGSIFDNVLIEGNALPDVDGLVNSALIAVRQKLKASSVNLGVAFGERKQTAMLLGSTATRIAQSVRALRRGEIRRAMNALGISSTRRQPRGQNVPQKWLELQYGWKPLLSDVYGAARALEQRPKGDWRVTASVTRSRNQDYAYWVSSQAGTAAMDGKARVLRSCYARIDAVPQNEATISLVSLGVTNPLSVAWELVPWSFVVDWAWPIGDWLDSLDALLGYGSAYYSSSFLVKASWRVKGVSGPYGTWVADNQWRGTKRVVSLTRTVNNSVPLPSLPSFKDPRSLGHMANGLALMATAFGRKR